jgi:hypothetical protein
LFETAATEADITHIGNVQLNILFNAANQKRGFSGLLRVIGLGPLIAVKNLINSQENEKIKRYNSPYELLQLYDFQKEFSRGL